MDSKCLICSATDTKPCRVGSVDLIHCDSCDIYYLAQIPSEKDLEKYYENSYQITGATMEAERRRVYRLPEQISLTSEISKYVKTPANLLDIGCDKGFFLDEARRYGFSAEGMEPSPRAREYCQNIGLKVYPSLDKLEKKYAAITLWHSLEHHRDPVKSMKDITQHLLPGGYVFIRVPDFGCGWRKIFQGLWIWFQPKNHYFHYTARSLRHLLEQNGFEVVQIDRRKPCNTLTYRAGKLSNKVFRKYFDAKPTLRERIVRIYEHFTGVELLAIGKLK